MKIKQFNQAERRIKFEWHPEIKEKYEPKMRWGFPLSWHYLYPVSDSDGIHYGEIRVIGSCLYYNSIFFHLVAKIFLLFIFSIFIFVLLYPLSNRIPRELFIIPIMDLLLLLKKRTNISEKDIPVSGPIELREIQEKIIELISQLTESARKAALGNIAAQVAHDRSPLAALEIIVKNVDSVAEDQRILMRSAMTRIHDIANNLLSVYKSNNPTTKETNNVTEYIANLVINVVSEKRIQNKHKIICLDLDIKKEAYYSFACISASSFKRILSNLIENAIEAVRNKPKGLVQIVLAANLNNSVLLFMIMVTELLLKY